MTTIIIAAHDPNLVIGKNDELPWHYAKDLKQFKKRTMGHPVLMGRKVFEELNEKPLPGRENLILTTTKKYSHVKCFASKYKALQYASSVCDTLFIIGGAVVYKQFLSEADYLYITEIHKEFGGDTYFPEYRHQIGTLWQEIDREEHEELTFVDYKRV